MERIKYLALPRFIRGKDYAENIPFIFVGITSGLACCFYAKVFHWAEDYSLQLFKTGSPLLFFLAPLAMISSYLLVRIFAPGASGSGIPQVMSCLEKPHSYLESIFLNFRVIVVKIVSSLVALFGGAAIGREGPSIQISAAIANLSGKFFQRFDLKIKYEQLVIAGAASGLSAAFNTPIGGIIYAVEELSQDHIKSYKNVLLLSVVIAGFTAQLILGRYLVFGFPQILPTMDFRVLAIVSVVSLIAGFLGACFSSVLLWLIKWRSSKKLATQLVLISMVGIALVGIYLVFGERAVFSGRESIDYILFNRGDVPFSEAFFRFFSPLISSFTGIAGGIFAPSLSAGAAFGGFVADLINPELKVILGLSGMIAFLTGVTRTPITSFVLVVEMTDKHSSIFPMMFAAFFGSLGALLVGNQSFYEASVEMIKKTNPPQDLEKPQNA